MKRLEAELLKLKGKGESSLTTEIEALLGVKTPKKEIPFSHLFLALASAQIQTGDFHSAHESIGAAIEAHLSKELVVFPTELQSHFKDVEVKASETPSQALKIPLPDTVSDHEFVDSSEETVIAFADVMVSAGYSVEAKKYVEAFHALKTTIQVKESEMKLDTRKALLDLRADFKKQGNLAMVKATDMMLEEIKEGGGDEVRSVELMKEANASKDKKVKTRLIKASFMMKAAEEMEKEGMDADEMKADAEKIADGDKPKDDAAEGCGDDMTKKAEGEEDMKKEDDKVEGTAKPTLYVEAASTQEVKLRSVAAKAASRGDMRAAQVALAQVNKLETARLVAALIKAGDLDLAMEGLKEGEDANAGFGSDGDAELEDKKKDEAVSEEMEESKMPEEKKPMEDEKTQEPEADEPKEEDMALDHQKVVESCVRRGKLKEATAAFSKLVHLEEAVVAGIKLLGKKNDKKTVLFKKEGLGVWRAVAKARLSAEKVLAEHEKDDEVYDSAMEGMEMLEDESKAAQELDKALDDMDESKAEELTKDFLTPPGGAGEQQPPENSDGGGEMEHKEEEHEEEEEMEEGAKKTDEGEESDAMHVEVLQSLDEVKAMNVDRNALAFTFWEDDSGKAPFYVIQAAGKPIAEIHLADQDNASEIRAYFCDEGKYTKALAQSVENTNLFEMLKGVHARFYANAVDASAFAKKMKEEAVASVGTVRTEKLATLRKDFSDAMIVASDALNKGLYNTPNALKSAFVKTLASLGVSNPAIAVEAAFKEAGALYFSQVMDAATEYLEMPKEAFAHAKKMVATAQNVAFAQANSYSDMSIGQELARNSLPFGSIPDSEPVQASSREWNERARVDNYKQSLKLGRKF